jgi:hypothetical protein
VAGTPLTFTAAIDNVGTSGTGFGFPVLFQVKDGGGTLLPDLVPVMASPISAGGYRFVTSPSSPAYTFSSSGSYTVRACADKSNRNDVYGYITESNEYNNCGAWTPVTVASSITGEPGELRGKILKDDNGNGLQDAGEVFIRDPANPGCIKPSYAQAITISYGGGNTTTLNQCSSNTNDPIYSVNLDPGAYTVSASLPAGWEFIGPSTSVANISSNVMTLVQFIMRPIAVTTTANINANPSNNIPYNTSSLLNWSYANATSCTITPPGTISGYPSGSGSVSTGNLTVSRTYTISCNPGPVTDNVQVTVQAQPKNLVVVKAGQGTVTGTSNPPQTNIDCGPTCQANYDSGTVIKLTETPNSGRIFTGWSGVVCSGASESQKTSTCTFTIGNDLTIVASFAIDPNYREF